MGALVVAASTDNLEDARKAASENDIAFALGYDLVAREVAAATGAFFNPTHRNLHSTGFVIGPTGKVVTAIYSTAAVGRLTPEEALAVISGSLAKEARSRGM